MSLQRTSYLVTAVVAALALSAMGPLSATLHSLVSSPVDAVHAPVMQLAAHEVATARTGPLAGFTSAQPLTVTTTGPRREVFGFALASSLGDPTVGYPTWQFQLLSTVAFFGLHVNDAGAIVGDSGWVVWSSSQLTGLVNAAHSHGTKVVVTIILQDFSAGTPHMCAGLANRATTVAQTVAQVTAKGVDGVNLDYEGLNGVCPNGQTARSMMTDFAHRMRDALPAGSYLSIDTYASSAIDSLGFFDVPGLNAYVDSFFVMAYDLEYSNYARSPLSCVRFCLGPTAPLTGYYYNDTTTAAQYSSAVGAGKVILGVPYYGRKSCVGQAQPHQYPTSAVAADGYLDAAGEAGAPQVKAGSYAAHRDANDPAGQERWDTWVNTTLNCIRELYWDDATSLSHKYDLVNRDNLRGVGIWTLNYGGGAPELWAALSTYFLCAVTVQVAATQPTTAFNVGISATGCSVAKFQLQQQDVTANDGVIAIGTVTSVGSAGTTVVNGYPNHTYQIQARAVSTGGVVGPWATASTSVALDASYANPFKGLYSANAYGALSPVSSPALGVSAYWPGWPIARAAHVAPGVEPDQGAVLDGYGGLHTFGTAMAFKATSYWKGFDIARDFAFLPDASGGYVLDGYGGLHPFSVNGKPMPPAASTGVYWKGQDIAKRVVVFGDGTGGYVLDAYGGVHPFGIGGAAPAAVKTTGYWAGWKIVNDIVLVPGTHAGYVLDGYGGLHPFGPVGTTLPAVIGGTPYWKGWNIARAVWLLPSSTGVAAGGYVMDGYGALHRFGTATATPSFTSTPGHDVATNLTGF
jgi:spore germination protein YaaH